MHEDIFAAFLLNEAESLGVIEPLHLSLGHRRSPARESFPSTARQKRGKPGAACGAYIGAK